MFVLDVPGTVNVPFGRIPFVNVRPPSVEMYQVCVDPIPRSFAPAAT